MHRFLLSSSVVCIVTVSTSLAQLPSFSLDDFAVGPLTSPPGLGIGRGGRGSLRVGNLRRRAGGTLTDARRSARDGRRFFHRRSRRRWFGCGHVTNLWGIVQLRRCGQCQHFCGSDGQQRAHDLQRRPRHRWLDRFGSGQPSRSEPAAQRPLPFGIQLHAPEQFCRDSGRRPRFQRAVAACHDGTWWQHLVGR